MIEGFPLWIEAMFLSCVLYVLVIFHFSNGKPWPFTLGLIGWAVLHGTLAYSGFYFVVGTFPPRFTLIMLPLLIVLVYLLLPGRANTWIQARDLRLSIFLHSVRIPMEIILWHLFLYEKVPELMTFEGRNFDILAGITAPVVALLWLMKKIGKKGLLAWNFAGLGLILFILANGTLSAELPFQQFAFDQPNRAVTFFPFILLPAVVVPLVVFTHIIDIMKLIKEPGSSKATVS